ncbi:MAG TPA: S8 family serine peptidase [Blastocatellia bacterium]|nr:S8 family serine peptidase [Blastocatellia bacterium]
MKTLKRFPITCSLICDKHLFNKVFAAGLALSLLLPIVAVSLIPASAKEPQRKEERGGLSPTEKQLVELAAANRGMLAADLEALASTTLRLPLTRVEVSVAKLYNAQTEEVFEVGMDANGREVDLKGLRQAEEQAHAARYGKLDPFLHDRVRAMRGADKVKVAFWLRTQEDLDAQDPRTGETDLTEQEVEDLIARRTEQLRKATADAVRPLRSYLGSKRLQVDAVSLLAPVVYATVPVKTLSTLAGRADVQRIYFADNNNEDYMNVAAPTLRADSVWSTYGITGDGVKVAIVEDSRVDFNNTCLVENLGTRVPGDSNVDSHATATAGMVASNHATIRGIAPGAGIYSANGTTYADANMSAALDAGALNAHILNNSWGPGCPDGSLNVDSRHADYIVRYRWDTVVAAAGNSGGIMGCEFVGGVAAGYNVIAVGSFKDRGTVSRDDDVISAFSSFKDPTSPHGDREKPEVVAPGEAITSTLKADPSFFCPTGFAGSGNGTSYSSPMVAGVAALMMSAQPALKVYPEAVKALILAGATHNLEGSARLSDKDGAGGVDALTSFVSAGFGNYQWMAVYPSSFDSSGYITINPGYMRAGKRLKVALVWSSNPSRTYSTDPLQADLDLNVLGAGFSYWSSSWDNSYEVVDFTVPSSGYYTIRIRNRRFDGINEHVAVAWN